MVAARVAAGVTAETRHFSSRRWVEALVPRRALDNGGRCVNDRLVSQTAERSAVEKAVRTRVRRDYLPPGALAGRR